MLRKRHHEMFASAVLPDASGDFAAALCCLSSRDTHKACQLVIVDRPAGTLEGVPLTLFGHSYLALTTVSDVRVPARLAGRLRTTATA